MTTTEREQLIKGIDNLERFGLQSEYVRRESVILMLQVLSVEPTENSTEDMKDSDRCCHPNWEAMYKEEAAKNEDLRARNECQTRQLERAWASLRTFEFVYGRKLDGIR